MKENNILSENKTKIDNAEIKNKNENITNKGTKDNPITIEVKQTNFVSYFKCPLNSGVCYSNYQLNNKECEKIKLIRNIIDNNTIEINDNNIKSKNMAEEEANANSHLNNKNFKDDINNKNYNNLNNKKGIYLGIVDFGNFNPSVYKDIKIAINIQIYSEIELEQFNDTIISVKNNINKISTEFDLHLNQILIVISLLGKSIHPKTFKYFFSDMNNQIIFNTDITFTPSSSAIYYSETELNIENYSYRCIVLYNHNFTEYTSEMFNHLALLPHLNNYNTNYDNAVKNDINDIDNNNNNYNTKLKNLIFYCKLKVGFMLKNNNCLSLLLRSLIIDEKQEYVISSGIFNHNNNTPLCNSFNCNNINNNFITSIYNFEKDQEMFYDQHFRSCFAKSSISNELYIMKLDSYSIYIELEKYYQSNNFSSLRYFDNIEIHNVSLSYYLSNVKYNDNKYCKSILVSDSIYTSYNNYKINFINWIDINSKKNAGEWARYFFSLIYLFNSITCKKGYSIKVNNVFFNIYYIITNTLKLILPALLTMSVYSIFLFAFNLNYNLAYGFTALYPLCYVIILMVGLSGQIKNLKYLYLSLCFFLTIYFLFVKICIIVAINNSLNDIILVNYFNKAAFISLFILFTLFYIFPWLLYVNINFKFKSLISLLYSLLVYPCYFSLFNITGILHVFKDNNFILAKLSLILIFILINFFFSLLIYAIKYIGHIYSFLLTIAIIGFILMTIKSMCIIFEFFYYYNITSKNLFNNKRLNKSLVSCNLEYKKKNNEVYNTETNHIIKGPNISNQGNKNIEKTNKADFIKEDNLNNSIKYDNNYNQNPNIQSEANPKLKNINYNVEEDKKDKTYNKKSSIKFNDESLNNAIDNDNIPEFEVDKNKKEDNNKVSNAIITDS